MWRATEGFGRTPRGTRGNAFAQQARPAHCCDFYIACISKRSNLSRMKRVGRGGARRGAGRPRSPLTEIRRNRVVVLFNDAEFENLERCADERQLALGTLAREIIERSLRRKK